MKEMKAYINLHVTPKSGKDEVCGIVQGEAGPEVKVRVTAPPEDGKANKAVCKLIASELGVPKSSLNVVSGDTSRHKRLAVDCDQSVVDSYIQGLQGEAS